MSNLYLAKLFKSDDTQIALRSTEVYDVATKKYLSAFISDTNTSIAGLQAALTGHSKTSVVADITARDALTGVNTGDLCWAKNASADSTVSSGAACYIAEVSGDPATVTWTKVAEAESMDVVLNWADIQDKPSSTVSAIDQAVTNSHTHSNSTVLAGLSADATSGNLVFNSKELTGETGIAIISSTSDTPSYTGQVKLLVEAFDPAA